MPSISFSFSFDVEQNPVCWTGALTSFENKLLMPLPSYALDQLRVRFMHTLTTTHEAKKNARALAQMAFETEIGAAIGKVVLLEPEVRSSVVCERRRYLDVDADMKLFSFLVSPALEAVRDGKYLPDAYVRLFETHLASPYAKYRMCAIAALLCVSAQIALPA